VKATFRPTFLCEDGDEPTPDMIQALIIDESGGGVEIRIMQNGTISSHELTAGVEHYRLSPLWEEVIEDA
jgi:hypothetical protein